MTTWTGPSGVSDVTSASAVWSPSLATPFAVTAMPSSDIDSLTFTVCALSVAAVACATKSAASTPTPATRSDELLELFAGADDVEDGVAELQAARATAAPVTAIAMVTLRITRPYVTDLSGREIPQPAVR